MASVFLSYDRDDTDRARHFARAFEKAGHQVWWDLHVRGGAQFSKVIEEALRAADAVVVLWSAQSVESPWVRDEAAAGRDTNRLVPVTIDGTEPPLGFRQFQTVDLSRWFGRGRPAELRALLADVDAVHALDSATASQAKPRRARFDSSPRTGWVYQLALAVALILVAGGGLYWVLAGASARPTNVAVAAADQATKPLARDLLINLGSLRSLQGGAVRLLGDSAEPPDLVLEASSAGAGRRGANLVLMSGKDRSILWSQEFNQELGSLADLKLRMTYTAERVLGCALEGLKPGGKALRPQTLKLYLTGCSQFAEAGDEMKSSVVPVFREVVNEAPRFRAGWAKLLLAESHAVSADEDSTRIRADLQRHIVEARKLDPKMVEATLAEVTLLPSKAFGEALRLLDEAQQNSPGNPAVLLYRTEALGRVGRLREATADAANAAEIDPTSLETLNNYVLALAYAGRIDAAREELQRAERLWPGTERLRDLQYAFQLRFGDPKEMLDTQEYRKSSPGWQMYLRTKADPTPANVDRVMTFMRDLYRRRGLTVWDIVGHSQAYGEFHRENDLYELIAQLPASEDLSPFSAVMFRPSLAEFHEDPRFMTVAKRMGLVDYWAKSGKWPDFCFNPGFPYDCKKEAARLAA